MDSVTANRITYSQYEIEDLNELNVATSSKNSDKSLRNIASEIALTIPEEWNEKTIRNLSKSKLIERIIEICIPYKSMNTDNITEEKVNNDEYDYQDSESEQNEIAKSIYKELNNCLVEIFSKNLQFSPKLIPIANKLKPTIEQCFENRTGEKISDNHSKKLKGTILKKIETYVKKDYKDSGVNWEIQFKIFADCVNSSYLEIAKKVIETTNTNIKTRKLNAVEIKVSSLINWATDILTNLPENSAEWRNVAIALMITTGRRQSEIMATGKFNFVDDNHVLFSGQLKRHTDEVVESFEIPTLVNANAVINGLNWLTTNDKRCDNQKDAHNRFSRYLSETAKKVASKYIEVIDGNWEYETDNGKIKDRKNCHIFRQIYAQIAFKISGVKTTGKRQYLVQIMGHSDSKSSLNWSADNYDSDVIIAENENFDYLKK